MGIKIDNIVPYLSERYPKLGIVKAIEPIKHNNIHSFNYLISFAKGDYVLKRSVDGSCPMKMERICRILDFCLKRKSKVVKPIKDKNNKYIDIKKRIYLMRYYKGGMYSGKIIELRDIAENIAILHLALAKNKIPYNYAMYQRLYKHLTILELKKIKKEIINKKQGNLFDKKVFKRIPYLIKVFSQSHNRAGLLEKIKQTKQLIHYDIQPGNVIFYKNKVEAILDFNAMRKGQKAQDLAFSSFRFSSYKIDNIEDIKKRLKIFINAYLTRNSIGQKQLAHLHYYYIDTILGRISLILRKRYFVNSDLWSIDFDKNINLLKLAEKVGKFYY